VTGFGFQPKAILFVSHGTTQSTADTGQTNFCFSMGAVITGGVQLYDHAFSLNAAATSTVATAHGNNSVIATTASAAIDSKISVDSLDSDGFTYSMPVSTLSGYLVGYLALG
jgi:mannose/cellobiose epimerase-like protein (N-acyl-D-glucosamine 2-epimerase family)